MRWLFALGIFACTAVTGCHGDQEIRQYCSVSADGGSGDASGCPTCASASDCVLVSNPCHSVGYCAPKAVNLQTTEEGCQFDYTVPKVTCACVQQNCQPTQ